MTTERRKAYIPVGYGPRACPDFASNISMMGFKAFLKILLPKYDVVVMTSPQFQGLWQKRYQRKHGIQSLQLPRNVYVVPMAE
jgi:cytochrome P450